MSRLSLLSVVGLKFSFMPLFALVLLIAIFFQLNTYRFVSRFYISCLPNSPVPDCARLSGKIPQAQRGRFLRKPVRARPCSIQIGTGLPLQAEIKKRMSYPPCYCLLWASGAVNQERIRRLSCTKAEADGGRMPFLHFYRIVCLFRQIVFDSFARMSAETATFVLTLQNYI